MRDMQSCLPLFIPLDTLLQLNSCRSVVVELKHQ